MIRLTTPTHYFIFPDEVVPSELSRVLITYAQAGKTVLEKSQTDMTFDGQKAYVHLTQEETKRFIAATNVQLQIRALTSTGEAYASQIITVSVKNVLNDEVLA